MSASRSRSRSPVRGDSPYELESSSEETQDAPLGECRQFYIENFPSHWNYRDVKQFIKDRTNSSIISDAIKFVSVTHSGPKKSLASAIVKFADTNTCKQAHKQLKAKQHDLCEGNLVFIRWEKGNSTRFDAQKKNNNNNSKSNAAKTPLAKRNSLQPPRAVASHDTYGLNKEFLDQLGIKLPILNVIFIANLEKQVDEAKLREVFGIAGQIVDVFIINSKDNKPKMAKIEYDHPLEAVQAISMFHNQTLFGRLLVVQIDNAPHQHSRPLPAGLASIGLGLGPNGTPMRGIRYTTEIQPLKELVHTELRKILALINPSQQNSSQPESLPIMNPAMTPLNINTMTGFNQPMPVANPFVNSQGVQNLQMLQGLLQQNAGNDTAAALASIQAQAQLAGFGQSYGTGQGDVYSRSMWNMGMQQTPLLTQSDNGGSSNERRQSSFDSSRKSYDGINSDNFDIPGRNSDDKNMMTTDMLIFNNLPSSVTLSVLKSKMCEVGEIKFAEITDEGKAIVRFCRANDAERCVKLFDRCKVDGQTIQVRFF